MAFPPAYRQKDLTNKKQILQTDEMKYFFTILLLHFYLLLNAQITYTKIPLDLQLVARDKATNLGNVTIEGIVDITSNFEYLRIETYRNDLLLNSNDKSLNYIDSKAVFAFNASIPAELANYTFKIYGYTSSNNLYVLNKTVSNIVAGDAIIIQGQSNAVAAIKNGSANTNQSDFIRVYANGVPNVDALISNNNWYYANGDVITTVNGNTGQWGLKLARLLMDELGIPIAVFNGAHSGQGISFFKAPNDYKTSLTSNYGRLYYRLNKTELLNNVRAIFWSQGEANAGSNFNSISNYKTNFKIIENSWLTDFPNLEKIYIFQTKDCTCNATPEGLMNIKEAQRQLAEEDEKISIIPTTSLLLHVDDCHFPFKNGYESFSTRIHKLVLQDLYGKSYVEEINAPMIKKIEFTEPNMLTLETDAIELKFSSTDQATLLTRLRQDFVLKNAQSVSIVSVVLSTNKIIFTLSGNPGSIANISYVGYNSNIGYTITNSSDLELISFRNFPIKNTSINGGENSNYPIIDDIHICSITGSINSFSVLTPNPNAVYSWYFKSPSGNWTKITSTNASTVYTNFNSPILDIRKSSSLPVLGTLYKVVATIAIEGEFTSNEGSLTFDTAPISKQITANPGICIGESTTLNYASDSIGTIQWQYSTTSSQQDFIDLYDENELIYTASDLIQTTWFRVINSNGVCAADNSPAIQVIVSPIAVAGFITGGNISVCKTTNSTVLSLNNSIGKIQWQKASTLTGIYTTISLANTNLYTVSSLSSTSYFRAVLSSGICPSQITEPVAIQVEVSAVSKIISGASAVCYGDSKILTYGTGSVGTIQWQFSTESATTGFLNIENQNDLIYNASNLEKTTWFRVKNTIGSCSIVYSPAVQVVVNPKAVSGFIIGGDVNVCKSSNTTVLNLNNSIGSIQWQKAASLTGIYTNIPSVTSSYTATGLLTKTYFRAILSSGICPQQITEPKFIDVDELAIAKTIVGASAVCYGGSKTLVYETGSVGTIQWEYSNTSSSTGFTGITNENGVTVTANNLQLTTWYRVKNSNGSCPNVFSPSVQVSVNQKPISGEIIGGNITVCKTTNSTVLKLQNYVGTIQWQFASMYSGTYSAISGAILNSYTASGLIATTYFRAVLTNGICPAVSTEPVAISISQNAISKTILGATPVCAGDSINLTYDQGFLGAIQWQFSTTSSTSGFNDISLANSQNYTTNNLQQTTWFRVKNSIGSCSSVYSPAVQVVVTTKPVAGFISGGNIVFCKTTNTTTLVLNNSVGSIQWQKSPTELGTYSNLTTANSTSYTVSGLATSGYYRAVVSNGICTIQTTQPVYIKIDEPAVVKTISGASPICFGESKTLYYETGSVGIIQWQYSKTSSTSGFTDQIGENDLIYFANNLQQTTWIRVKNTSGSCPVNYSTPVEILVNTTPPPTGNKTQYFNFSIPVLISNLVVKGTDIKWYSTNSNAFENIDSLEPSTILTIGSTYFAMQTLNRCVSVFPLAITVTKSLEIESANFEGLEFYPNPFKNYFKLKYSEILNSLELFNILGKSVLKINLNVKETTQNIENLPSGIYFMELTTKNKKGVIKGIKL